MDADTYQGGYNRFRGGRRLLLRGGAIGSEVGADTYQGGYEINKLYILYCSFGLNQKNQKFKASEREAKMFARKPKILTTRLRLKQ